MLRPRQLDEIRTAILQDRCEEFGWFGVINSADVSRPLAALRCTGDQLAELSSVERELQQRQHGSDTCIRRHPVNPLSTSECRAFAESGTHTELLPWSRRIAERYVPAEAVDATARRNAVEGERLVRVSIERIRGFSGVAS